MRSSGFLFERFERERVLLSRFAHDPIVGGLRDKKKNCSTRKGLRGVPDLGSFFKLLEVGVSPYLCFILILSVFRCLGWFEVVRGRLIGPKTWDRSVRIFKSRLGNLGTVTDCYGFFCDKLLNKLCFGVYKTGNG